MGRVKYDNINWLIGLKSDYIKRRVSKSHVNLDKVALSVVSNF